jgi:cathepsin A (carboxypeptidase C)
MKLLNDFLVDAKEQLSDLADQGLPILIYNGDKDYICNWEGSEYLVDNLPWKYQQQFRSQEYRLFT